MSLRETDPRFSAAVDRFITTSPEDRSERSVWDRLVEDVENAEPATAESEE